MKKLPLIILSLFASVAAHSADTGWPYYGGDEGGTRYSNAAQITRANVTSLQQAWSYSTRDMTTKGDAMKRASFENTPILADGRLYVCSPFDEVSALDPGNGRQLWRFDPKIDTSLHYPNSFVCRGVAYWKNPQAAANDVCASRIFLATNDRRVIALDAKTGKPCAGFGKGGTIAFTLEKTPRRKAEMQITSAPVVSQGIVIVGSSIDDNQTTYELRGTVHAFDAVTGAPKWMFNPLERDPSIHAGAANVWSSMSVDDARGLVFLPTSSPSPDFYGGLRKGDDRYANAVVALHVADGTVAWSFQTAHHDVWDYDVPAQPTLANVTYKGRRVDAVLQATKQGLLFTLDRDTGAAVIPVQERKVPQGGELGEQLSPTQPFPIAPHPLAPNRISPDDAFGLTFWDKGVCRDRIAAARHEGLFTPPSTKGTILYPFTGGGTNWGGLAFDPAHDVVYVNTSSAMHLVTLIPRKNFDAVDVANPGKEVSPQEGTPFGMMREVLVSPLGLPCNPPPWGLLHAIDMHDGHELWSVPLGTTEDIAPFSQYVLGNSGTPNLGGPIVTASGLVFIGAAMDNYLRAFDARTGVELWKGRLPAGGQATPMTYVWHGRQYVVIAAGGHDKLGTTRGDQLVAFALPR